MLRLCPSHPESDRAKKVVDDEHNAERKAERAAAAREKELAEARHDLPRRGKVISLGQTYTQSQVRGYLRKLRNVLSSNDFDDEKNDSTFLSLGASICQDLSWGNDQTDVLEVLQLQDGMEPFEANLYYSVAVGELCTEHFPHSLGDS